jgi:hypothetical protein
MANLIQRWDKIVFAHQRDAPKRCIYRENENKDSSIRDPLGNSEIFVVGARHALAMLDNAPTAKFSFSKIGTDRY